MNYFYSIQMCLNSKCTAHHIIQHNNTVYIKFIVQLFFDLILNGSMGQWDNTVGVR